MVHSYKDNICVLSLLIILGRDDFSDWFPHFGPFEDGEAMFHSEWIHIYCTVPGGIRVKLEKGRSLYTPTV